MDPSPRNDAISDEDTSVIPLFHGYSVKESKSTMKANCSCTLIKGASKNLIVDTMTAWDGARITEALEQNGLSCEDIDYVICTHGHSDHTGCNYLFPNATHVVGFCVSKRDVYSLHNFGDGLEYVIEDKIKVVPTPGHTLQDVSVLVELSDGIVAITGDLFEKEEDLEDPSIWIEAGSDSEDLQRINREKILSIASWIVPGHGPLFPVPALE